MYCYQVLLVFLYIFIINNVYAAYPQCPPTSLCVPQFICEPENVTYDATVEKFKFKYDRKYVCGVLRESEGNICCKTPLNLTGLPDSVNLQFHLISYYFRLSNETISGDFGIPAHLATKLNDRVQPEEEVFTFYACPPKSLCIPKSNCKPENVTFDQNDEKLKFKYEHKFRCGSFPESEGNICCNDPTNQTDGVIRHKSSPIIRLINESQLFDLNIPVYLDAELNDPTIQEEEVFQPCPPMSFCIPQSVCKPENVTYDSADEKFKFKYDRKFICGLFPESEGNICCKDPIDLPDGVQLHKISWIFIRLLNEKNLGDSDVPLNLYPGFDEHRKTKETDVKLSICPKRSACVTGLACPQKFITYTHGISDGEKFTCGYYTETAGYVCCALSIVKHLPMNEEIDKPKFMKKRSINEKVDYNDKVWNFADSEFTLNVEGVTVKKENIYKEITSKSIKNQAWVCGRTLSISSELQRIYAPVGDREAKEGDYPWHVAVLSSTYEYLCSGVIVGEKVVITIAHCFDKHNSSKEILIRVGDLNLKEENEKNPAFDVRVKHLVIHPAYDKFKLEADIAVIELEESVRSLAHVRPACLPRAEFSPAINHCQVPGWGQYSKSKEENHQFHYALRVASFFQIDKPQCQNSLRKVEELGAFFKLQNNVLCAKGYSNADTCKGDGGSGLVCRDKDIFVLQGLVSYGFGCGLNLPGVYTDVQKYLNFIDDYKTYLPGGENYLKGISKDPNLIFHYVINNKPTNTDEIYRDDSYHYDDSEGDYISINSNGKDSSYISEHDSQRIIRDLPYKLPSKHAFDHQSKFESSTYPKENYNKESFIPGHIPNVYSPIQPQSQDKIINYDHSVEPTNVESSYTSYILESGIKRNFGSLKVPLKSEDENIQKPYITEPEYLPLILNPEHGYHPKEPELNYIPSIKDPVSSYLPPINDPESDYLPPILEQEYSFRPPKQDPESDYIPPTLDQEYGYQPHIKKPESGYLPPIKDPESDYLSPILDQEYSFRPPIQDPESNYLPPTLDQEYSYQPHIKPESDYLPPIKDPESGYLLPIRDSEYLPTILDQEYNYQPPIKDPESGYLPLVLDQEYGYRPHIKEPESGYLPTTEDSDSGYLPPIKNPDSGYLYPILDQEYSYRPSIKDPESSYLSPIKEYDSSPKKHYRPHDKYNYEPKPDYEPSTHEYDLPESYFPNKNDYDYVKHDSNFPSNEYNKPYKPYDSIDKLEIYRPIRDHDYINGELDYLPNPYDEQDYLPNEYKPHDSDYLLNKYNEPNNEYKPYDSGYFPNEYNGRYNEYKPYDSEYMPNKFSEISSNKYKEEIEYIPDKYDNSEEIYDYEPDTYRHEYETDNYFPTYLPDYEEYPYDSNFENRKFRFITPKNTKLKSYSQKLPGKVLGTFPNKINKLKKEKDQKYEFTMGKVKSPIFLLNKKL